MSSKKWEIPVDYPLEQLKLTVIYEGDRETFVKLLGATDAVYQNTLRIPYPYTLADADWFINFNKEQLAENGYPYNFAVRNAEGELMGVVGIVSVEGGVAEVGYWLGEPYWGKGIASHCLRSLVQAIAKPYRIHTFTATIFSGNSRSISVVTKVGFQFDRHIPAAYVKNEQTIDADNYIYVVE